MTRGGGWWWHRSGTRNAGAVVGVVWAVNGVAVCSSTVILDLIQDLLHRWVSVGVLNVSSEMLKRVQHDGYNVAGYRMSLQRC